MRAELKTARWALIATLIVGVISLLSYLRGSIPIVQGWGEYFWFLTYSNGFIKRGLVGTLFQSLFGGADHAKQMAEVLRLHLLASMALTLGLLAWLYHCIRKNTIAAARLSLVTTFLVFATSQFLPTVAYNTGYLDVYLYCLFVAAAWLVAQNSFLGASAIGLIGPFIHEDFIFLWASIVVIVFWIGRRSAAVSLAAIGILATGTIVLLSSVPAEVAQTQSLPIPADMRSALVNQLFRQSVAGAFLVMVHHFQYYWRNFFIAIAFFGLAPFTMIGTYAIARFRRFTDIAFLCLATVAPLLVLTVAWDLSRFIVQTALSGITAILVIETCRSNWQVRPAPGVLRFAILVAVIGALLPPVYAYFEFASVVGSPPFSVTPPPIAKLVDVLIRSRYDSPPK